MIDWMSDSFNCGYDFEKKKRKKSLFDLTIRIPKYSLYEINFRSEYNLFKC